MIAHRELTKKAKEVLKKKGFSDSEIYEKFWFKNYLVDTVGWNPKRRVAVQYGNCSPRKKKDLERFFDEVICLTIQPQIELSLTTLPMRDALAKMRLVLVKDDDVVLEVPLSRKELPEKFFEDEIGFLEQEFQQFSRLFNALAHENRLRIMQRLIEDDDLTAGFAEFIRDLDLNPKLVWENTRKLSEGGFIEKSEDGRYRCSEFGEASFIMLSFFLRQLRDMLENVEKEVKMV
ncbi:MAG: ArsR/SmtB family transcription factor [Candidatus Bathyarchaeia archaeon]